MQLLAGSPTAQLSIIPMPTSIVIPTHIPMLSPMARSCWLAVPPMNLPLECILIHVASKAMSCPQRACLFSYWPLESILKKL